MSMGATDIATTVLSGPGGEVRIGDEHPFAIIGERINPTGRAKLTEELNAGDMTTVQADALAQVRGGRGASSTSTPVSPGSTSRRCSRQVVKAVHEVVDVPLCIDSSTPEALEAAVPLAQGKVLINSVTAEAHSIERLLPLGEAVRRRGDRYGQRRGGHLDGSGGAPRRRPQRSWRPPPTTASRVRTSSSIRSRCRSALPATPPPPCSRRCG